MAWRIDEFVVRGEIDNCTRGRVTGRIWFVGRMEPVELDLRGDCWRDLAGRRLAFSNPEPSPGLPGSFAQRQEGAVGDVTASRKVRVPDIPMEQIGEYYEAKKPFPWHWGNALYLEWYGARNGRVVIETAAFTLTVIGEPAWEMSSEDEERQREKNAEETMDFMRRLGWAETTEDRTEADADEKTESEKPDQDGDGVAGEAWAQSAPQTEDEAEAMQARSDLLADRVEARMQKAGEGADYEAILEEELERLRRERGEPEPTPEQLERNAEWIEEMNRAANEVLANPDPEALERVERDHPLAEKAFELSVELHRLAEAENWIPEDATQEHPAAELVNAASSAGAKLAGALNGDDWPPEVDFCAGVIVRLKRARGFLEDALAAAECCRERRLVAVSRLDGIVEKLRGFAEETDALIAMLRARLERGMD